MPAQLILKLLIWCAGTPYSQTLAVIAPGQTELRFKRHGKNFKDTGEHWTYWVLACHCSSCDSVFRPSVGQDC